MKVIGLTGGIGSGKSTVAYFLAEKGAYVLDADKIGHEAFKQGTTAWQKLINTFGKGILDKDNEIDRSRLAGLVFGKPEALAKLNEIMHPYILEMVKTRLNMLRQQGVKIAVLEATLLVEAGWKPVVDEVWVTIASTREILNRLERRSNYSQEESLTRIHSQRTNEQRLESADVVIDTDCSLEEVRTKVHELLEARLK